MSKGISHKWYYGILSIPLTLFALLPFPLLYLFSDFLHFLFYRLFPYRLKVVANNLQNAFPNKTQSERDLIAKAFYYNLFDVSLETLKAITMSKRSIQQRVQFKNLELIQQFMQQQQSVILVGGHSANWEWAGHALQIAGIPIAGLYHPLSNKWFDWFMYQIRSKFGMMPVAMHDILRFMLSKKDQTYCYAFIADQTASAEQAHWLTFLNQDTAVFMGTEKLAKKFNMPVVFCAAYRNNRGYYTIEFDLVSATPNQTEPFQITVSHTHLLEQQILRQPAAWLWSHRRWKHQHPNKKSNV
jgi:KDO2-lipid IV(A) lauroyltransferase